MNFWQGIKGLFFQQRKVDRRNEYNPGRTKLPKATGKKHKPNFRLFRRHPVVKYRGHRRRWCPGPVIPVASRERAPTEERAK